MPNKRLKPAECPTCKEIPDYSSAFYKPGRGVSEGSIPAAADKLEIIGYPYFKESSSGSNHHVRRCPLCGSIYAWRFSYEFCVEGSEDTYELERLTPADGKRRAAAALAERDEAQAAFEAKVMPHIAYLDSTLDPDFQERFADYAWGRGSLAGYDLTFALPALMKMLERHSHNEDCKVCSCLQRVLLDHADRGDSNTAKLAIMLSVANLSACSASIRAFAEKLSTGRPRQ